MTITVSGADYNVTIADLQYRGELCHRVTVSDGDGVIWSERIINADYLDTIGADGVASMDATDAANAKNGNNS